LVDEKTGREFFHPKTGRPPKMKRSMPISDYLYSQKDAKNETLRKLSDEMKKLSSDSVHVIINKESEMIVEKRLTEAFDEIFNYLDSGKTGKLSTENCSIEGILIKIALPSDVAEVMMPIFQEMHDNNYELEKEELFDAYKRLYANLTPTEKVVLLNIKRKGKQKESSDSSLFRPEIDSNSAMLASKKRMEGVNIEDKLIDQGKAVKIKIEEKQKQKDSRATEGCTFSPSINQRLKKVASP
jgi:hypothetical protein